MRFWKLVWRALRLRCPFCGQGKLFRGWWATHSHCPRCALPLAREPGFYLGSIYLNYGLTATIAGLAYPALLLGAGLAERWVLLMTVAFTLLFPLWFFRYARGLWLGFDQFLDPRPGET